MPKPKGRVTRVVEDADLEARQRRGWHGPAVAVPAPPRQHEPLVPQARPVGIVMRGHVRPGPLCRGKGCGNIPIEETPGGPLCKTCAMRLRGYPDRGTSFIDCPPGTTPPWQGYKDS